MIRFIELVALCAILFVLVQPQAARRLGCLLITWGYATDWLYSELSSMWSAFRRHFARKLDSLQNQYEVKRTA